MSARRLHRIGRDFPTICRAKMWRSILMSASVPAAVARDLNVIADGPAQSLHPLQKCSVADLHVRIVRCVGHERAHAPHGLALLRARRERPRRRAANKRNELAAPHVEHQASSRSELTLCERAPLLASCEIMLRIFTQWLGNDCVLSRARR
jgi:hypothetical protein